MATAVIYAHTTYKHACCTQIYKRLLVINNYFSSILKQNLISPMLIQMQSLH